MPATNCGGGSWKDYIQEVAGQPDETAVLAEACLAFSRIMPANIFSSRSGGAPAGRPDRAFVRAAGAKILDLVLSPTTDEQRILRILGLLNLHVNPAPGSTSKVLASSLTAIEEAEQLGDEDTLSWALATTARMARAASDHELAEQLSQRALEIHGHSQLGSAPWSLSSPAGKPRWLPVPWIMRAVLAEEAAQIAVECANTLGDFDKRTAVTAQRTRLAEQVRHERPRIYARALQGQGILARALGDYRSVREAHGRLIELVNADGPEREAARALIASRAGMAKRMEDWSLALDLNRQRLELVVSVVQANNSSEHALDTIEDVLEYLESHGDRAFRATIGNAFLGQASALYKLGLTDRDIDYRQKALGMLDLADMSYRGFGNNGFSGVQRRRTLILHDAGVMGTEETVNKLLEISHQALDEVLQRGAVLEASRICLPGDNRVRDRVLEGLSGPLSTNQSRYRAALATWLSRVATAGDVTAWAEVLEVASLAAEELVVGGRMLEPLLSLRMWRIAWEAHEHVYGNEHLTDRMPFALNASHALATQLVTNTQARDRAQVLESNSSVFPEAAALAIRIGDPVAAELVMEAARRERVGLLLGELSRNPAVGKAVREAAATIVVANAAVPEESTLDEDVRAVEWQVRSADAIQNSRDSAILAAASVIGPAAALADLAAINIPLAASLIKEATVAGQCAAVLQLYRSEGEPCTLFWAVALSDGEQHCGQTELPERLPHIQDAGFWTATRDLAKSLLPEPLVQVLRECATPVRLTIIPTGLLGIAFDQLPIGDDLFLAEKADVVMAGSLAMANALKAVPLQAKDTGRWLSVYDHDRLKHARTESDALAANHEPVETITSREELFAALDPGGPGNNLMALGLHGSGDETGWAQAKLLPDGSIVIAAEALRWEAPRLAVLSSCHSKLETVEGTELSGFPAALLLRGSTTVIGSLAEINDNTTAQIMSHFWNLIGSGAEPAHALAQAKRDWLQEHPEDLANHGLWAPIIAYGIH